MEGISEVLSRHPVVKLTNVRVAIADYGLIKKDFPHLSNASDPEIDKWLIEQAAYFSERHANKDPTLSRRLPLNRSERSISYRPEEYGRAFVKSVKDSSGSEVGLIDVKGAGIAEIDQYGRPTVITRDAKRNGFMSLGEGLREFSMEKLITTVFDHSGIDNKVVGGYAVLDIGGKFIHEDETASAAGLYLRQAHQRPSSKNSPRRTHFALLPKSEGQKFTRLLQRYGISVGSYGLSDVVFNVQATINNDLVDFGHFIIRDDMRTAVKELSVPFQQWGFENPQSLPIEILYTPDGRWHFSNKDRPWIWSHETAAAFVSGHANRHHVWANHYNLLNAAQDKLSKVARAYDYAVEAGFQIDPCQKVFLKGGF